MTGFGRPLLALFVALLFSCAAYAADRTPEAVVRAFFSKEELADKKDWFAGEIPVTVDGPKTIGQDLPSGVTIDVRPIQHATDRAVYAVVLTLKGESLDWYAYLSRESGNWQLEAVRALVLPGFIGILYADLRGKKQRTTEEELRFRNLELTFQPDARLKSYFVEHQGELEDIKNHFLRQGDDDGLAKKTKMLSLAGVQRSESGCIEIVIGGFMDNLVGYMFVPEGTSSPPIDRSNYIMIDQIAGRWYLYKTT